MTMTLIETKTLGTGTGSIAFVSIPQDGTDLLFVYLARAEGDSGVFDLTFNSVGTGYSQRNLLGFGSGSGASFTNTVAEAGLRNPSAYTADTFASGSIYIPNYTGSTAKSFSIDAVQENNATGSWQMIAAGLSTGTAAITSVELIKRGTPNFATGSTFSLYKITKGSDGIVTTS
jgi:hypothetical protein